MAVIAILYPPNFVQPDEPGNQQVARIAGAALTAGQAVYDDSAGKAQVADAAVGGKEQISGIVLEQNKAAGQSVPIARRGLVAGFDLSGLAYGALVYLDTAGNLNSAVNATKTVPVGRVVPGTRYDVATSALCKVLEVWINPIVNY